MPSVVSFNTCLFSNVSPLKRALILALIELLKKFTLFGIVASGSDFYDIVH